MKPSIPEAERFACRYPSWWDRAFDAIGLGPAEVRVVLSVMRWAKWTEDGRCLLEWGNVSSAKQAGVGTRTVTRAKTALHWTGLARLERVGSHESNKCDIFDVSMLARKDRPEGIDDAELEAKVADMEGLIKPRKPKKGTPRKKADASEVVQDDQDESGREADAPSTCVACSRVCASSTEADACYERDQDSLAEDNTRIAS